MKLVCSMLCFCFAATTACTESQLFRNTSDDAAVGADASMNRVPDPPVPQDASSAQDAGTEDAVTADVGSGTSCLWDEDPLDAMMLLSRVSFLASDALKGRAPGTPEDQTARAYIEDRFRCLGLTAPYANGSYQQPFATSTGLMTANVVAYLPGSDPMFAGQIILIGAHHDHLGIRNGRIHNGANDNASGVIALLAVAQAIRQRPVAPRRTIAFVAFGYEEHSGECEGSEFYVLNAPPSLPLIQMIHMLDLDMVGTYASATSLSAYGSVQGTVGRAALEVLAVQHPNLQIDLGVLPDEDDSDFQAFCDHGIPYVYFETWDDTCYHSDCDDAERLDYPNMSRIVALSRDLVIDLADDASDLAASRAATGCPGP